MNIHALLDWYMVLYIQDGDKTRNVVVTHNLVICYRTQKDSEGDIILYRSEKNL